MSWWRSLFLDFHGRIGRKAFWIGYLIILALFALFYAALWFSGLFEAGTGEDRWQRFSEQIFVPVNVFGLLLAYPSIALFGKRLHDLGHSAWWNALIYVPYAVYLIGFISGNFGTATEPSKAGSLWLTAYLYLVFGITAYVGSVKGQAGVNRYGEPDQLSKNAHANGSSMGWWRWLFGFKDRISRKDYWLGIGAAIGMSGIAFLCGTLLLMLLTALQLEATDFAQVIPMEEYDRMMEAQLQGWGGWLVAGIFLLGLLLTIYSFFTLAFKRLHDRRRSGFWLLLPVFLFASVFVAKAMSPQIPSLAWLVAGIPMLWLFVELGFIRGTRGPNRYGDDPLKRREAV